MKILSLLMCIFSYSVSAFPMEDIYKNLDITSFNSSLIPLREGGEKTFQDFNEKLPAPIFSEKSIVLDNDYWTYSLTVIKTSNNSGYHVCFKDKAKVGTYDSQKAMIIRKYDQYYVAINSSSNVCESYAK
ncbi:hypothetical protein GTG28_10730 [Vibrio sp. OCN044]|uniref:Pesticin immunity protein n=1 Tax=Vibrio tetraodonis subsp. pristinus TaxID=2695891 RepID=A0A6L8LX06_9VIBR|nr:hypothetical protein [Vibrio tetraodonis]MYM59696.1 hypothetical protein [Vibrio tetraodonis subsp. pristinus]